MLAGGRLGEDERECLRTAACPRAGFGEDLLWMQLRAWTEADATPEWNLAYKPINTVDEG